MGEHQEGSGHTEKHHYSQNPRGQENELQSGNKLKVLFFFQDHLGHANKFWSIKTKMTPEEMLFLPFLLLEITPPSLPNRRCSEDGGDYSDCALGAVLPQHSDYTTFPWTEAKF